MTQGAGYSKDTDTDMRANLYNTTAATVRNMLK
jgi:hypothetical protein